jgi:FtsZ-binding cell division protein ZapB
MLTFAFTIIGFFLGIAFTIWFFFAIISSTISKVSDGFGMMYDTWCAKSNEPKPEPEVVNFDLGSIAEAISFAVSFAVEKMKEFEILNKEREEQLKSRHDAQNAAVNEKEDLKQSRVNWQEYLKNYKESLKKPEGNPEETPKIPEGNPTETLQETLDNQGFPESDTLIEDSKIPKDSIWKTTL